MVPAAGTRPHLNTQTQTPDTRDVECTGPTSNMITDVSNKVDIAKFRLQNTTIRYNFSSDGYLHLR